MEQLIKQYKDPKWQIENDIIGRSYIPASIIRIPVPLYEDLIPKVERIKKMLVENGHPHHVESEKFRGYTFYRVFFIKSNKEPDIGLMIAVSDNADKINPSLACGLVKGGTICRIGNEKDSSWVNYCKRLDFLEEFALKLYDSYEN